MSPFDVTFCIRTLSLLIDTVKSDPAPTVNPESFNTPNDPVVVSFSFDFKNVVDAALPNASESVDVPVNLFEEIAVDNCIPLDTVENPAAINAAAFVSVPEGVNATGDVMNTTESPTTPFNIDLFAPVVS